MAGQGCRCCGRYIPAEDDTGYQDDYCSPRCLAADACIVCERPGGHPYCGEDCEDEASRCHAMDIEENRREEEARFGSDWEGEL